MTPNVTLLPSPMKNDWGYKGPGAYNPYFCPTGTAPDRSRVPNFYGWFNAVAVYNTTNDTVNHWIDPRACASVEGAQEALRLVQMFVPAATLGWIRVEEGGIYYADKLTPQIVLPNGKRLNAGTILNSYYHAGAGVSAQSDIELAAELEVDQAPPVEPEPIVTPEPTKPAPMPDGPGVLGAATFAGGVFLHGAGSEAYPLGATVTINGKKYEKRQETWNEVK